jgi:hypothetical protein
MLGKGMPLLALCKYFFDKKNIPTLHGLFHLTY